MKTYQACLQSHAHCVVCSDGSTNPHSLQLSFKQITENEVAADYQVDKNIRAIPIYYTVASPVRYWMQR